MSDVSAPPPTWSVAIIRARYNPFGGAERFVQRALAALADRPLALTVIARHWQAPAGGVTDPVPAGVHWERIDPFHIGRVWRDASFARAVQAHLARHPYQLVQSHERIPGVMIYRAGDGVHAEFLEQRRRALGPAGRLGIACNPYHHWLMRTERRMFTHPALRAVICNSEMVREEIAGRFGVDRHKLRVIRNGVDLERFAPPTREARQRARLRYGLAADEPVLAFVGAGFERKGLAGVLRAMAHPAAPTGLRLLVAGTDKHASRYRSLAARLDIQSRVIFLGGVDDVLPVLHAADGFVLPTLYDPFPNAVLEALACGLPTLTSTKCGAAEVITTGVNGFVTDALDLPALAAAMAGLVDPAGAPARREAARASVARFSSRLLGDELLGLYSEFVPGAGGALR